MARVNITAKNLFLYNPLPTISEADVFERAQSVYQGREGVPAFLITHHYAPGDDERETILEFNPQEGMYVRPEDAPLILGVRHFEGMVLVDNPDDEKELLAKSIEGIRKAIEFYRERGARIVTRQQVRLNLTQAQIDHERAVLDPHYVNEEKAKILTEFLNSLTAKKPPTKRADKVE